MGSPRVIIDPQSNSPVRRQIFEQIRMAILDHALQPNAELPSVRRLATDLGVHFNTVAEAYRLLAQDGWLEIVQGRGARVAPRGKAGTPTPETAAHFRQRLRELIAEMRARGFTPARIARELAESSEGIK